MGATDEVVRLIKKQMRVEPLEPPALNYRAILTKSGLSEAELRRALAELLKSGRLLAPTRHVYLLPNPYWFVGEVARPILSQWRMACLIAADLERKIALCVEDAEWGFGFSDGRCDENRFALEGLALPWRVAGLVFEPAPELVWTVSRPTASLIQGMRRHIDGRSVEQLQEFGRGWGRRHKEFVARNLMTDLDLLPEPYRIAAEAAITTLTDTGMRIAARRAPRDFCPPAAEERTATLEGWRVSRVMEANGRVIEVLSSRRMWDHPRLSGQCLTASTELVWIDVAKGYARTLNTLYRLAGQGICPDDADEVPPDPTLSS